MAQSARTVEVRVAQFRAVLAVLLLVFTVQNVFFTGSTIPRNFLFSALAASLMALAFSLLVIWASQLGKSFPVTKVAIFSIGIDAALLALPVTLFVSIPEVQGLVASSTQLLNQPSVFAMYLLVIASGLRFREVARLGMGVNGCVILCLMGMEVVQSQGPEGFDPVALFTVRQHVLLLICSILLAWLISTHVRTTTLLAAEAALHANIDGLTGVYNRHYLREELNELSRQRGQIVHLIMLDVDFFKKINDELGHVKGDLVLVEVARRLQIALRSHDLIARYGGEEFCVLLKGLDDETAAKVAERLRRAIEKEPIEDRPVTISVGCSRWHEGEPISDLLERADKALYSAKETGRNRVVSKWKTSADDQGMSTV